ncbi:MAG TPA: isoleucine--tRNA ligase [Candidatus Saccharimonadales bacterium]|nr:isoleucine--tRNA ligase [Candidatus Saccharimonadales bacterium]
MKKAEQADFPRFEAEMLKVWDEEKIFEQSVQKREGSKRFSFYDGPPFANGLPHYGHVVALTEKDAVTRYKTMRGYHVPRRNGWDTHGLPVENAVEKQLGINSKREILDLGIEKFNEAARASVFKYKNEWEDVMRRIGRWADMENSYATLDDDYIESVWWVLSELQRKDLVYRGFRSNPYCPRCATPLSNFEVNLNYKDDVPDPSVYVKFRLADDDKTSLLAWTTTPWTLPANAALAVDAKADYVTVELQDNGDSWQKGERLVLAKSRLSELELRQAEYKLVAQHKGQDLAGKRYHPLYELAAIDPDKAQNAWKVYADESVSLEDGTGILHVAPRYGETDLALGLKEDLPLIESVDGFGNMTGEMGEFAGMFFKDADAHIIEDLGRAGRLFAAETAEHTYPFCWRCETPLMYFAIETWYIKVSQLRDKLVETNNQVNWVPAHIKQGRFGNWLADARDWNFSRNRFWGAPLPIWVNVDDKDDYIVVGSLDELRELSGHKAEFDLHRPGIDAIKIKRDGKTYARVEEVFDCWFESGSMPYAQDHYPFQHKEDFKNAFPAEFIAEGLDQTRGWFYTLHVLGTALFDQPAFKNVVVNGLVLAADGKKLSKRLNNYPDPAEVFDKYGADSLRFFFMSSPVISGEDVRFSGEAVQEVQRNVFLRLWNVYSFFSMYAEIDGWQPGKELAAPQSANVLDQWMLARVNQAIVEATKQADEYQIARAVRPLRDLIDDLSNWYVRRSRRRFWKSEDDGDKQSAYATLHYCLLRISQLLAPWSPFIADKMWRELSEGMDVPASVHLSDWPKAEVSKTQALLIGEMQAARVFVTDSLSLRAAAGIKVRQPLAKLEVPADFRLEMKEIISEEVNVKEVVKGQELRLDTEIGPELKLEGIAREVIRTVQQTRKDAGLDVDDRIELGIKASGEVAEAIEAHSKLIRAETLTVALTEAVEGYSTDVKIGGTELRVSLAKSS